MKAKMPAAPKLEGIKSSRCLKKVCQQASTSVEGEAPIPSPCKYKAIQVWWHGMLRVVQPRELSLQAVKGSSRSFCVLSYAEMACRLQQVIRRLSKITGAYLEHSRGDMGASHQGSSSSDQVVSTPGPPL